MDHGPRHPFGSEFLAGARTDAQPSPCPGAEEGMMRDDRGPGADRELGQVINVCRPGGSSDDRFVADAPEEKARRSIHADALVPLPCIPRGTAVEGPYPPAPG